MEKKARSFFLEEPDQTYGIKVDDNLEFDKISYCDLLGQKSIPYLGIYGTYYYFFHDDVLMQVMIINGYIRQPYSEESSQVKKSLLCLERSSLRIYRKW